MWIDVLRDKTGLYAEQLEGVFDPDDIVITRFTQLELLQGARDEKEWDRIKVNIARHPKQR